MGLGGADTSTLTVSNNLFLAGTTAFTLNRGNAQTASKINGLNAVTFGGALTVTNAGAALQPGDAFQLFSAASYTGNFSALNLPTTTLTEFAQPFQKGMSEANRARHLKDDNKSTPEK